jgi:superfamily II DNA or RNA helicase
MSKQVVIGYNPVTAKIFQGNDKAYLAASSVLSYEVEGAEHTEAFRMKSWDGRSTFYNWNTHSFPRGLISLVEQDLRGRGFDVKIVNKPLPPALGPKMPEIDKFGYQARYDYQPATVDMLEKLGIMIARVATGGGKSRIAKIAHARIKRPTLFITTRKVLMYQMKDGFEASGWSCGVLGDGEWNIDPMLNVAMVQTLLARLNEPERFDKSPEAMRQRRVRERTIEFLSTVEFLIGEEAHEVGGDGYFDLLSHFRKAEYRLALTATPFMKTSAEANMRLMAAFGQIGIEISEKMLIERGILAKPYFKFVELPPPKKLRKSMNWQRAYEVGIVDNEERNADMVRRALKARDYGLSTIALISRKAHGAALNKLMLEAGLRSVFIYGETSQKKRDEALAALKRRAIDVIIGSTILDVGVDVPATGQIILGGGGKAEVAMRQRIGRGLREKHKGPNVALVVDYKDRGNKHLQDHAISRQAIVAETPGFAENVLGSHEDFDFQSLGFTRVSLVA